MDEPQAETNPRKRFAVPVAIVLAVVLIGGISYAVLNDADEPALPDDSNVGEPDADESTLPTIPAAGAMVYFDAENVDVPPGPSPEATVVFRGIVTSVGETSDDPNSPEEQLGLEYELVKIEVTETYRSNLKPGDQVGFVDFTFSSERVPSEPANQQIDPDPGDEVFVQGSPYSIDESGVKVANVSLANQYLLGVISATGFERSILNSGTANLPLQDLVESFTSQSENFELDRECDVSKVPRDFSTYSSVHAFITDVDPDAGQYGSLTFDRFQWVDSDEFDYEIRNDDTTTETTEIAAGMVTWLTRLSTDGTAVHSADDGSLDELASLVESPLGSEIPFTLTATADGFLEICQVYVP